MSKRFLHISVLILFTVSIAYAEKDIAVKDLPDSIQSVFARNYPNAKIKGASQEMRDSNLVYEVESIDNNMHRDIIYSADGKALEIEEQIPDSTLPQAISKSIAKKYDFSKIVRAEKLTRGDKWEFELIVKYGGKKHTVFADSTGKILNKE